MFGNIFIFISILDDRNGQWASKRAIEWERRRKIKQRNFKDKFIGLDVNGVNLLFIYYFQQFFLVAVSFLNDFMESNKRRWFFIQTHPPYTIRQRQYEIIEIFNVSFYGFHFKRFSFNSMQSHKIIHWLTSRCRCHCCTSVHRKFHEVEKNKRIPKQIPNAQYAKQKQQRNEHE